MTATVPVKGTAKSSPRQHIMTLEKKLFAENKAAINEATVVSDPGFKKYWRRYKKVVAKYSKIASHEQVFKAVSKARIVLIGDYHTLDQSQRSFVRILRTYFEQAQDKRVTVALETVQARFQKPLDDFILGRTSYEQFIKKIGFKKHWFFDLWPNYKIIFDYLMYHNIPMQAIDADNRKKLSLVERDAFMAQEIVRLAQKYPDDKIFVLVGDLHLAPPHLPKEIQKIAQKEKMNLPLVSLYQNSTEIHWQLSAKGVVDHVDVVQLSANEFCRMHTPPLIVQQSYLNWLYHEDDSFDWIDAKGSFVAIVEQVAKIAGLTLPNHYDNIEVFTCGDLSFLKTLKKKRIFTKSELEFIEEQVKKSESYFMPRARMAYIANVSIHHAAEEATHYLKFLFSGEEFPRLRQDAFYANVLHEAIGFFGSKLINAKRKCPHTADFKKDIHFLKTHTALLHRDVRLKTAIAFLEHEKNLKKSQLMHPAKIMAMSPELFLSLTHAIGYDLGDRLYYGFMAGQVPQTLVKTLFMERFEEDGETGKMVGLLSGLLKNVQQPVRV